jgi:uncharacterized protein
MVHSGGITVEEGLRYAMSLPVAVTISGMESPEVLRQNLAIARGFERLNATEMDNLRARCREDASDGRYELFKTSKKYDGDEGRKTHGYPTALELPAGSGNKIASKLAQDVTI